MDKNLEIRKISLSGAGTRVDRNGGHYARREPQPRL
jgi:hypothetical protein